MRPGWNFCKPIILSFCLSLPFHLLRHSASLFLFSCFFFLFAKEKECEKVGRAEKVTNNYINRQGGSPQKDGDEDIKQEPRNQNQHRRPERLKVSLTPHIHTSGHTHPRSPQAQLGWKKKKQNNLVLPKRKPIGIAAYPMVDVLIASTKRYVMNASKSSHRTGRKGCLCITSSSTGRTSISPL